VEAVGVDPGFWRGRRVLVTGHTGFKGSWLTLWLQSMGASVTGFAPRMRPGPSLYELADIGDAMHEVPADIRDAGAVAETLREADPEVVLHLAAQPIVRRSYREPAETFAVNVMGTANVLDAALASGSVAAIVVVTSDKCYDNRGLERGYREDEPLGGADPYSASKAAQELVAHAYRRSFELPLATARAGNVIGGGDFAEDRLVPDVMRSALAGEPVTVRNPAAVRPWQHVLEPLTGYLALAERLALDPADAPHALNFGPRDEDSRPVGWIVDRLASLWPDGIEQVPSSEEAPPPEASVLRLDSSLAASSLGWKPAWDLGVGLDAVVEWFVAYRDGADVRQATLDQIARHQGGAS
jgi:CDP-glucose 4,6-dehydratase